jgi:hypothetical protein
MKIEPVITIDEALGRTCASLSLEVVNHQWVPVNMNPEEKRLQMSKHREIIALKYGHGCHFPGELVCEQFLGVNFTKQVTLLVA